MEITDDYSPFEKLINGIYSTKLPFNINILKNDINIIDDFYISKKMFKSGRINACITPDLNEIINLIKNSDFIPNEFKNYIYSYPTDEYSHLEALIFNKNDFLEPQSMNIINKNICATVLLIPPTNGDFSHIGGKLIIENFEFETGNNKDNWHMIAFYPSKIHEVLKIMEGRSLFFKYTLFFNPVEKALCKCLPKIKNMEMDFTDLEPYDDPIKEVKEQVSKAISFYITKFEKYDSMIADDDYEVTYLSFFEYLLKFETNKLRSIIVPHSLRIIGNKINNTTAKIILIGLKFYYDIPTIDNLYKMDFDIVKRIYEMYGERSLIRLVNFTYCQTLSYTVESNISISFVDNEEDLFLEELEINEEKEKEVCIIGYGGQILCLETMSSEDEFKKLQLKTNSTFIMIKR